jgi:hypothetical protein
MPGEMRIISFIDQPGVIKKFFNTLVYGKSPMPLLKEQLPSRTPLDWLKLT